jgi:hypothetical protein
MFGRIMHCSPSDRNAYIVLPSAALLINGSAVEFSHQSISLACNAAAFAGSDWTCHSTRSKWTILGPEVKLALPSREAYSRRTRSLMNNAPGTRACSDPPSMSKPDLPFGFTHCKRLAVMRATRSPATRKPPGDYELQGG